MGPKKSIGTIIRNMVCEGLCPALMRGTPLQSYKNFVIENVSFPDGLQTNSTGTGESIIPEADGVRVELTIKNWTAKGQKVTMSNLDTPGQFNIDVSY